VQPGHRCGDRHARRDYRSTPLPDAPAPDVTIDDRHFVFPPNAAAATRVEVIRGPNVQPPPPQVPLADQLSGRVLIVVGDDISTGDLAPDGWW
jgi:aconitate hydratase